MRTRLSLVTMTLAILVSWASLTLAQETPAEPSSGASPSIGTQSPGTSVPIADTPTLWLRGPFGRVAGGTVAGPAAAAPGGSALDTFVRRAPFVLETDDGSMLSRVEVVARPLASPGDIEVLSRGGARFDGPSRAGRHIVVASTSGAAGLEWAWLVDVPHREPPEDGLYDIPAPAIIVSTGSGMRRGVLGDGCYVYLCVETGQPTPADQLEALPALVDETPELRIGDGSALIAWEGGLTPLGDTAGQARHARGVITGTPTSMLGLSGLEPPGPGEWLLDVEVELDRERGRLRTTYRLVVE